MSKASGPGSKLKKAERLEKKLLTLIEQEEPDWPAINELLETRQQLHEQLFNGEIDDSLKLLAEQAMANSKTLLEQAQNQQQSTKEELIHLSKARKARKVY